MADIDNDALNADVALQPYWAAAHDGRLLLKRCHNCAKTYYYPRPLCPFCMSAETEWQEASGDATIYSWSVQRRATPPYAIAFVTLAEGPTILTNIIDCDLDRITIGQRVSLCFETRDGQPAPVFKPV